KQRIGKFEMADGGTLFLDEVGDMSLKTQAKVLRALEEQRFERVGGAKLISVDVRVISASNKNLLSLIEEGRFREDLYYRLNVIPILVPPLKDRLEDIHLLADHFAEQFCREYGKKAKRFTDQAVELLRSYPWPGNVRELRNIVERVVIMTGADMIGADNIMDIVQKPASGVVNDMPLKNARQKFEREYIICSLQKHDWNVNNAAQELGVDRTSLYKKMRAYNITVPK
ncbi:MAG: sigma-54-dependent Fis family transcriptional regulator, partial [Candidatus Coatesbacteria bacterium]|nr:sigma-54-dependent Fis family transcriptional regulator [Candidatus Coatesbacteria bacterium]